MADRLCGVYETEKYSEELDVAAADHNVFMCIVGSFYRLEGLVDRLCFSIRGTGSSDFHTRDRQNKSSGTRGIPVLSDTGCHHRLCSGNPDCSRDDNLYLAIRLKYRNQFSDTGRIVYFQNEGYFTRNKKETESIKSCCEQLLKSYCKQLQQLLKAFDLQ